MKTLKTLKADLHVHSRFSNKPTYWAMRKIDCPESFVSPRHIYDKARERGMDFITITDHNTIDGALEIAHLPGAFISAEITAHFPENGCKIHVVVLDINEIQYREIMRLRKNVHEFIAYLHQQKIAHFIAHPLYAQNDHLTLEIIEKSLLLFTTLEVKNGCRAKRFNEFTRHLADNLTRETIDTLANRHNLQPYGATPWLKGQVGGSDDHSGLFIARAHTGSPAAHDLSSFLDSIKTAKSIAMGENGGPLTMAHSLYGIGHSFCRERFGERQRSSAPFVNALMDRFFNNDDTKNGLIDKIRLFVLKNMPASRRQEPNSFEELLDREARLLLNDTAFLAGIEDKDQNHKIFSITSRLANRLLLNYCNRLMSLPMDAGFFEYLNTIGTIALVHLLVSPYYMAFHHQHKGKELIRDIRRSLTDCTPPARQEKTALFTDTLDEINGVAITIKRLINTARERGLELSVITCSNDQQRQLTDVVRFAPVGDFILPEYPELKMNFPPILDVMDYIEREGFTRIHISTPGTVGLLGLLVARLMNIPVSGTYHTDIPQYVRDLTNDDFMEQAAWSYIIWFYNQMEEVIAPSSGTREQLLLRGIAADKIKPLPRWVDTAQFSPIQRKSGFWKVRGIDAELTLLYVGRISKEKALWLLSDAFCMLADKGASIALAIVGDGPYRSELEERLQGYPVLFTGYLEGELLQSAYASADLFVFPSSTDTFGNVVLEAQASGLPVIVSDQGGPCELIIKNKTGLIFKAGHLGQLSAAIEQMIENPIRRRQMGIAAREFTINKGPDSNSTYSTILGSRHPDTGQPKTDTPSLPINSISHYDQMAPAVWR